MLQFLTNLIALGVVAFALIMFGSVQVAAAAFPCRCRVRRTGRADDEPAPPAGVTICADAE